MQDYYFLKNVQTNEIRFYKDNEFIEAFGGVFEHIISNFCMQMYIEKQLEIPYDKRQTIFFMNFITNWNNNKGQWSQLEAISYYDLLEAEKDKIRILLDNGEQKEQKLQRNQNNKTVGNGEGSLYYSEALGCWIFQYYDTLGKRQTRTKIFAFKFLFV